MKILIKNETEKDYRNVEELTREAFWNLQVQGCDEHYMVHVMRNHPDFIKELDLVAVVDNRVVGNIMYMKSHIVDAAYKKIETLTFGPISVLPEYQRKGIGTLLIETSFKKAREMGYAVVIIAGHPHNYCRHGFKNARDLNISDSEGNHPYGLLVYELTKGFLQGKNYRCHFSEAYKINSEEAEKFDQQFTPKKKEFRYTQEEFSMACRAYLK